MLAAEADRRTRDVVYGFGEPQAAATLAALLLDFGLPGSGRVEVHLEGALGFQGVSAHSAEARLWIGYGYSV